MKVECFRLVCNLIVYGAILCKFIILPQNKWNLSVFIHLKDTKLAKTHCICYKSILQLTKWWKIHAWCIFFSKMLTSHLILISKISHLQLIVVICVSFQCSLSAQSHIFCFSIAVCSLFIINPFCHLSPGKQILKEN